MTTPSKPLADQAAREQIRSDLDTTLIVEAAAGTGKTTELVQRVMALLLRGKATLARLVAVTFTEKAAGEMKLRLRTEIETARGRATPDERRRLDLALEELEEAHIGTIHGFCAELLRQRPVEARVDPLFEAADEDQQGRLFDEAFARWFQGCSRIRPRECAGSCGTSHAVGTEQVRASFSEKPGSLSSGNGTSMVPGVAIRSIESRRSIRS